MTQLSILHMVNNLSDSSILRIILQIISLSDHQKFNWFVGSMNGHGELDNSLKEVGATILDYSKTVPPKKLAADIKSHSINIVHTHTPRTTLYAWSTVFSIPGYIRPGLITTKHLLTRPSDRRWGIFYASIDYLSLYLSDLIIPVSLTMEKQIKQLPGIQPGNVRAIPNGIPFNQFSDGFNRHEIRDELGLPMNAVVFGYAGRLDKVKRVDILLAAFKEVYITTPEARLLILGEGQLKSILQDTTASIGIKEAVIWAGYRYDMPRMFAAMDIYVQPSDNEGLSLSILEAMAAKRLVITTNVGGAKEVLVQGKTGWLVSPGSTKELAKWMKYSVEHTDISNQIIEAAYEHVISHYSNESMVAAYQEAYMSMGERKK
jgi:glycosyltransferase involved in cell wall biosynthesis